METDAFSQDVEPGGLRNRSDIRLLLCYLLRQLGRPLRPEVILSAIRTSGMANYFEAAAALEELQRAGSIATEGEGEAAQCRLSAQGELVADSLARTLPASVRERSVQAAQELLTRMKREQENKVTLTPLKKGYLVRCRIPDADADLLLVELRVPDLRQAERVRNRFMRDPAAFYTAFSALLTGDEVLLAALPEEVAKLSHRKESEQIHE